jgi:hypothetical protein
VKASSCYNSQVESMGPLFNALPRGALVSVTAILLLASTGRALAQDSVQEQSRPPVHIRAIDGEARLEREGQADPLPLGMPVIEGDVLSTGRGRIELQTGGGSVLDIDEFSTVEVLDDQSFRIREGRVALVASKDDPTARDGYRLETPDGLVTTTGPGQYQVAAGARASESSARFSRWIDERRRERAAAIASRQHLPSELSPYADTFDRYGSWTVEPGYGDVWSPRVEVAWQPYYAGYWSVVGRYGWTWISADPWGWPTHHYGRWHYLRDRWFWSAGRDWSPAWVTWGTSAQYISWCPVGVRSTSAAGYGSGPLSTSFGWIVVPQDYFRTSRSLVARWAVPPHQLDRRTPFIEHARPPMAASAAAGATTRDRRYVVGRDGPPPFMRDGAGSAERRRSTDDAAGAGWAGRSDRSNAWRDGPRAVPRGEAARPGDSQGPRAFERAVPPPVSERPPTPPPYDPGSQRAARRWPDRSSTPSVPPTAPTARAETRDRGFRDRSEARPPSPGPLPQAPSPPPQARPERGPIDRGTSVPMRQPPSPGDGGRHGAGAPQRGSGDHAGSRESQGSQGAGGHGAVRRSGR